MNTLHKTTHPLIPITNEWVKQMVIYDKNKKNHYVTTDWDQLPIKFDTNAKYQVHQDMLTALFLRHAGVPKKNIIAWHNDEDQLEAIKPLCSKAYNRRQNMKEFRDVGNVAFTISDDMFSNKINYTLPVDMIGPASYTTSFWFTINGKANKWNPILKKLENAGLYRIVHIPTNWFEQLNKNGDIESAKVQSCLYQTKPGYKGKVEVINLATNETYQVEHGGIYPKSNVGLDFYKHGVYNNAIKSVISETTDEIIADDDYLCVPVLNNGKSDPNIPSSYSIGLHTKTFVKIKKGDTIPKGCTVYKSIKDIDKVLNLLHSDKFARSYQAMSMQKTFSNNYIKMMQIDV